MSDQHLILSKAWEDLKEEHPNLRIKDAAAMLEVSEVELLATTCDGQEVVRLKEDWEGLFRAIEELGYVMALTRNESVVHEKKGEYHDIKFSKHVGLVLDKNIDLRIFPQRFAFAFAVPVKNPRGTMHSVQFFDEFGKAIHKIYLMNEDHHNEYQALVKEFRHDNQDKGVEVNREKPQPVYETVEEVDQQSLLSDWAALKDTHDFFPLLKKHKVERTHALTLAEGKFTQKVDNTTTEKLLERAASDEIPIMVFVSSGSVIQIHSGPVKKIKRMNNWLNVLDPEFNLHLRDDHISHSWIVEKPTEDGVVTSLEIFDKDNKNIATFFGERKPGKPELGSWRTLMENLKSEEAKV